MSESFSESLRVACDAVWDRIFAHPFLADLSSGELPVQKFRFYIAQDYRYLEAFGRAVALALGRAPDSETVRLLAAARAADADRAAAARSAVRAL